MGWVARACGLSAAALALTACTADAGSRESVALGPEVVADTSAPSGYTVTFRYEDAEADRVWLAGDLYYADAADIRLEGATQSWLGDDWTEGDASTLPVATDLAELTRGEDGVWEITTAVPAGLWNYGFVTSGCSLILLCAVAEDPANPPPLATANTATQAWSQVFVPVDEDHPTYDASTEIPVDADQRGTVSRVDDPDLGVYLPAGYDPDRAEPYPLLVLSHGAGDDETAWFTQGGAAEQLDHAIAAGVIEPTVAVTTDFTGLSAAGMDDPEFFDLYVDLITASVLPYAERELHTSTDPADRSFAGLSMGGRLAEHLMLTQPGLFGSYGMWSMPAAVNDTPAAALTQAQLTTAATASAVHLGTGAQDSLTPTPREFADLAAAYEGAGMLATTLETDGGHAWWVWRRMLADFLETTALRR
ncbi:alpha/beta hydrolase-fold protein [Demequina sp. NBRC 110057]|uniref:alpha/beta hydrolase-fold protein n=1 Tax=Demequina sp. NBRC 110057 TaxID=1570346 RepID=UPI000A051FDD|nr:alpha/beta hydrolase-fold protein [Demequina sp. NBRC 110057]